MWWAAGRVAGLLLVLASMMRHHSEGARVVAGRWTTAYTGLLGLVLLGAVLAAWRLKRVAAAPAGDATPKVIAGRLFDAAILAWGLAYFVGTWLGGAPPQRFAGLQWFGTLNGWASLLEWVSLVLAAAAFIWLLYGRLDRARLNLLLAVAALAAVLLLMEGLARVRVYAFPSVENFPGFAQRQWHRRYVSLNQAGYRDAEHATAAAPGASRLLVIGDSYAFGHGVDHAEERLGEQLAGMLAQRTSRPWESINAGRSDTHTRRQFDAVRYGLRYHPDVVLLLYVFNDIDYLDSVTVHRTNPMSEQPRSRLAHLHPLRLLFLNSYLFQAVYIGGRGWLWDRAAPGSARTSPYRDTVMLRRHVEDLAELDSLASSQGAVVALVPFDVEVKESAEARERYGLLVNAARARGLPVISLEDAFGEASSSRMLVVNRLDRHPNALANRLAAQAVMLRLLPMLEARDAARGSVAPQ